MNITKDRIRSTKKGHRGGAHSTGYLGISHLVTKDSKKKDWGIRLEFGYKSDGSDSTSIQMNNEAVIHMIEEILLRNATIRTSIVEPIADIERKASDAIEDERRQSVKKAMENIDKEIKKIKKQFYLGG